MLALAVLASVLGPAGLSEDEGEQRWDGKFLRSNNHTILRRALNRG